MSGVPLIRVSTRCIGKLPMRQKNKKPMEIETDQPRPIPPLQRHLQMETDLFCFGCGYNLHGQIVTHDERLGFLICRCPECGRFHPAAMGVSATRPWLARLGVMLASLWIFTFLLVVGLGGYFVGLCTYAHLETYTTGKGAGYSFSADRVMRPLPNRMTAGSDYYEHWETEWKLYIFFLVAVSLGIGVFTAVAMWHQTRLRQRLFLAYPWLIGAVVFGAWWSSYDIDAVFAWSVSIITIYAFFSMIAICLGQLIGRPSVRCVARLIVPPRLLQHVQFLWRCDGKTPPAARVE